MSNRTKRILNLARDNNKQKIKVLSNIRLPVSITTAVKNLEVIDGSSSGVIPTTTSEQSVCGLPDSEKNGPIEVIQNEEVQLPLKDDNTHLEVSISSENVDTLLDIPKMDIIISYEKSDIIVMQQDAVVHSVLNGNNNQDNIVPDLQQNIGLLPDPQEETHVLVESTDLMKLTLSGPSTSQNSNLSKNNDSQEETEIEYVSENSENSSNSSVPTAVYGKKKRKKENLKEIRKSKKVRGEGYIGYRNMIKSNKEVRPNPCVEGCPNACNDFSDVDRNLIFVKYWAINHQRQRDFLLNHIDIHEIRRRRVKSAESRKSLTRDYYLPKNNENIKVCRRFFMNTLDVTDKLLRYTEANRSDIKTSKVDKRGKHFPKNKTPVDDANIVISFINKLPAIPSHYCRKQTTRKYLPSDFNNISNVYRIYEKYLQKEGKVNCRVSLQVFKKIFKTEFNIGFHVPKKDKCLKCENYKNTDKEQITKDQQNVYDIHLNEKKSTNEIFIKDQKKGQDNPDVLCTSFDLQKVLGTPNGDNFLLGFSSKYAVYNLTFYESVSRNVYCYLWGETDGKRGANEICSIMYKYLRRVDEVGGIQEILLYCDSCAGQNKNHQMLCLLQWFLKSSVNLEKISLNFLLPGHSYMPVDSVHGTIEQAHKKKIIFAPSEWPTIIRNARHKPRPYEVFTLTQKDFLDYKSFTDHNFPKVFKTEGGTNLKMRMVRRVFFTKDTPDYFTCSTSFTDSSPLLKIVLPENKARRSSSAIINTPQRAYKIKLPIAAKKYMGLRKLCTNGTIPASYHSEFFSMAFKPNVEDRLMETDEEDENIDE